MVLGWRRAFCTSIPEEKDRKITRDSENSNSGSRISSKFGFLSNPSTPRLRSDLVSKSGLRCRTSAASSAAAGSLPNSPKLQCKTTSNATPSTTPKKNVSPRIFSSFSNPSSPRSPSSSSFSLLKNRVLQNRSGRCGICLQRVKTGEGTAIFTAECSHSFHFPCVGKLADNRRCPVCSATWREPPLLSLSPGQVRSDPKTAHVPESGIREVKTKPLRVYNDDEPLMTSPTSMSRFNTILESDETHDVEEDYEFPGFSINTTSSSSSSANPAEAILRNLEVKLQPEAAVVATGKRNETHAVVMKVKAPPHTAYRGCRRPPVDLVAVLDVTGGAELQSVKQALRLVISILRETDRLSIVVLSSGSKRVLPLRRMTGEGRRLTRRIADALVGGTCSNSVSVGDALKKAAKVLEDRREKNPSASILVLSDGQNHPKIRPDPLRSPFVVSTSRFSQPGIRVHTVWVGSSGALSHAPVRDAFTDKISGLLRLVLRDVSLHLGSASGSSQTEIASVYNLSGEPKSYGSGSVFLGDVFADEDREILVEIKVPASTRGSHHVMSVRSESLDPTSGKPILIKEQRFLVPRPQAVQSSSPVISRLKSLHVSTRAVVESRRLVKHGDLGGAYHTVSSARSMLAQLGENSEAEFRIGLEAELAELNRHSRSDPITPTSSWKAAERLAKVATMKKHMNRVSDLHGLENARF